MGDSLLIDQRRRWEQGDRVLVETYLTDRPGLRSEIDQVLELIEHELVLREERGETPQLEEYVRRFPDLARDLQLHFEVHAALQTETMLGPAELEANGSPAGRAPALAGYEVLGELGRGGMGVVYKARQAALNRVVALKMILAGPHANAAGVARFRREAEAVAQLAHPHIVQIYEVGESEGRPYLALEYVDSGSLDLHTGHLPQSPVAAARLLEALARAMHFAHQRGVIHRDLKPANVLLARSDLGHGIPLAGGATHAGHFDPKVTDFGLAKLLGTDMAGPTLSGEILGTPSYMAPEQAEGKSAAIGPATDIWALGAILYELLTGRPPFQAESALETLVQVRSQEPVSPSRLQPKLPRDLVTICLTCLHKDPRKRYASAEALANDLRRFLDGQPIQARPINAVERTMKWVRRRPAVAALLATIVVVAAAGVTGIVHQLRKTEDALEVTKGHLYLNQIARAQQELHANHYGFAERLLDETDPAARGWEYRYLKRQCQPNLFVLRGNGSPVQTVAYSPDGRLLASGNGDWYTGEGGELNVWDARTGEHLWNLGEGLRTIYGVAFHPDSRRLASGCRDGKVHLHDAQTGQWLSDLHGHSHAVHCMAFSRDGQLLASGSADLTVRIWEVETGKTVCVFRHHRDPVWGVAFSPDGLRIASCDWMGVAHLWDPHHGTVARTFGPTATARDFRAVAFRSDGGWLAQGCFSGHIIAWDLMREDFRPIVHQANAGPILSLVFTPNGCLAWSTREGHIRIQDLRMGIDLYKFGGHEGWANTVAVSPDGRRLASAGTDGTVRIHDATAREGGHRVWEGGEVPGLMFEPNGRLYALGGHNNAVMVWEIPDHLDLWPKKTWSLQGKANPTAMAGSPDGRFLAWVVDNQLHVRDRYQDVEAGSQELEGERVTGLAYSADSRLLAWGDKDGRVRLCDAATGHEVRRLGSHGSWVTGVSFHPNGKLLATAGQDGRFCIWDLNSDKLAKEFDGSGRPPNRPAELKPKLDWKDDVTRIAFSPDGDRLAAANPRRPLEIWDVAAGRVALILDWQSEGCSSAAWSAKDQLAAAFGFRIKVWGAAEQSLPERRQASEGSAVAWHQNEAALAQGRWDWFAATYHLGKLIDADWFNTTLYYRRAIVRAYHAEAGRARWEDAAADMAKAVFLNPGNAEKWYQHAVLSLFLGDRDRYRAICAAMLALFEQTKNAQVAHTVARACCLAPDSVADPARVVALARRARAERPGDLDYLNTLGTALYRAGHFDDARQCLAEAAEVHRPKENVRDWLSLAMTYHQLGQPNEAQRWLEKAATALDRTAVDLPPPGARTLLPWYGLLELRLLRREATSLLQP
jgi:WD40 repeat protein